MTDTSISDAPAPAPEGPPLTLTPSRGFPSWLAGTGGSLAFTTYQAGKLFLVGTASGGGVAFFERTVERPMGLHADADGLWLATLWQLWRFTDTLQRGQAYEGHDALYAPRRAHVTGDLDVHDVAVDARGRVVFVNTLFSCLATVAEDASFAPLWRPPFVSRLAAEDRCHLNGLAMRDGRPGYVTAVAATDVADGWREHRRAGGLVMDVGTGETVVGGLSMPHSPRWHRDALYCLQAGTGELGRVDLAAGRFEPIAFLPGFARGLCFVGDHAVVGLSLPREGHTFAGLAVEDRLREAGVAARCAVVVVDLRSGDLVHWLAIEGVIEELYDVAAIAGVRHPAVIGFRSDEVRHVVTVGEPAPV